MVCFQSVKSFQLRTWLATDDEDCFHSDLTLLLCFPLSTPARPVFCKLFSDKAQLTVCVLVAQFNGGYKGRATLNDSSLPPAPTKNTLGYVVKFQLYCHLRLTT